jgi:hypothetical protein
LTVRTSGRRWLKNCLVNFLRLKPESGNPLAADLPLVICASGPSLVRCLPLLSRVRSRVNLWALPSALPALEYSRLIPDVVVATDPGHYASTLLDAVTEKIPCLAMPLCAARGSWRSAAKTLLFMQPNFFEYELARRSGLTLPALDTHGTVAGTALLLAAAFGAANAVFCGLDFCFNDLRSHVVPHAWDVPHLSSATRVRPTCSVLWARALEQAPDTVTGTTCRSGRSLAVYAASFAELCRRIPARRLFPSPVDVPGMEEIAEAEFERTALQCKGKRKVPPLTPRHGFPDISQRVRIVDEILAEWLLCMEQGKKHPEKQRDRLLRNLLRFFGRPTSGQQGSPERRNPREATGLYDDLAEFLATMRRRFAKEKAYA